MEFLLAFALPPVAVWRSLYAPGVNRLNLSDRVSNDHRTWSGMKPVGLCTLLWLLGILPGIIYAVWFISQQQHRVARHQPQLGRPNPFGSP